MVIDYKNSIYTVYTDYENEGCVGAYIGAQFFPRDMIEKVYEKINESVKTGYCREKPKEEEFAYYQWNGDPNDIGNVKFLEELKTDFTVGDRNFENFHLDYHDAATGEIIDLYPGDYIIDRKTRSGSKIDIRRKEEFEAEFFFGK